MAVSGDGEAIFVRVLRCILFLCTFSATVALSAPAWASACDDWLRVALSDFAKDVHLFEIDDESLRQMLSAIFQVGDDEQGVAYEIENSSGKWMSTHTTLKGGHDPLGDSRWPLLILGRELGAQLEFFEQNGVLGFPSRDGFLNWFAGLFPNSKQKPSVKFYKQNKLSLALYLQRFGENAALPLADPAENINHYLHDLSLHLSAIFIPQIFIEHLQTRALIYLDYAAMMRAKYPTGHKLNAELERQLRLYEASLVDQIDNFTGQATVLILFHMAFEHGVMPLATFELKRERWVYTLIANLFGAQKISSNTEIMQPARGLSVELAGSNLLQTGPLGKVSRSTLGRLDRKYHSSLVELVNRSPRPAKYLRDFLEQGTMARRQAVINAMQNKGVN